MNRICPKVRQGAMETEKSRTKNFISLICADRIKTEIKKEVNAAPHAKAEVVRPTNQIARNQHHTSIQKEGRAGHAGINQHQPERQVERCGNSERRHHPGQL